jgi:hypothetical protein
VTVEGSAIPLVVSSDPVDVSSASSQSLWLLRLFGYKTDAEILAELQASRETNAKIFWQLLSCERFGLTRLGEGTARWARPALMSARFVAEETPPAEPEGQFHRKRQASGRSRGKSRAKMVHPVGGPEKRISR